MIHTWIAWTVFPASLVVILGGAMLALGLGYSPSAVAGLGAVASLAIAAAFERIQPYRREWNLSHSDLAADAVYLPSFLGLNAMVEPLVRAAVVPFGAALATGLGIGLWPSDWSLLAQFLLACVVVEAFDYWPHRLLHEVPVLWRFHAIHHNPKRLYWLNATRAHPLEVVFRGVVNVVPLALLGADEQVLAMAALADSLLGLYQHANIDFRLGPLSWIFSVGEMHRWHHSLLLEEANNNYGSNFLFWDVLFGTRYRDATRSGPDEIGIQQDDLPTSWAGQLAAPFHTR